MYCYDAWVIGGGVEERFTLKVFSVLRHGDDVFHAGQAYRVEVMILALELGAMPVILLRPMEAV